MHFVSLYKNKNEISEIVPFIKYLPGEDLEILSRKDYVGIGCLDDGQAVGLILARVNTSEKIAELTSFYIEDDFRKQGLGTKLLNKLIKNFLQNEIFF